MKQYDAGISGELAAEHFLSQQGLSTVARRYRNADGEIDLIMLDQETIVFVEVKARPNAIQGAGLAAVTRGKQRRVAHAALAFLVEKGWTERPVRFDVVEISRSGILHIPNAFIPTE